MYVVTLFALGTLGALLGLVSANRWKSGRRLTGAIGLAVMLLVAVPFFFFAESTSWGAQRMGACGMITALAFAIAGGGVPDRTHRRA